MVSWKISTSLTIIAHCSKKSIVKGGGRSGNTIKIA